MKAALRGHGRDSVLQGWQISGTIFARTGFPYTVVDAAVSEGLRQNNYFGLLYTVPAKPLGSGSSCGKGAVFPLAPKPCQPPQILPGGTPNPGANFVQAGCETRWENATLGIGFQFFNLFNHPNFGFPDISVSSPTGQIFSLEQSPTSILGTGLGGDASPRMIQVKAQVQF